MTLAKAVRVVVAAGWVMLAGAAAAAETPAPAAKAPADMSLADIQACMKKNLVDRAALRDLSISATDKEGKTHALKVKLYWKPAPNGDNRINLRLVEPVAVQGSSYLLLQKSSGEEVYFYLPGADRSIRISGQSLNEPLWNTDFSYAEIKQVLGLIAGGKTTRLADSKVGDRAAFVLQTDVDADSGYSKVLSSVDQQTCVLLVSNFFGKGDAPLKMLEADTSQLLTVDAYSLVLGYTMHNLRARTRTVVNLSDFTLLERMPERLFDPQHFYEPFE